MRITYVMNVEMQWTLLYELKTGMIFNPLILLIILETIAHVQKPQKMVIHLLTQLGNKGALIASVPTRPTVDGTLHQINDFTISSFYCLFSASNYQAGETLERV
jgi:hypothetical protein